MVTFKLYSELILFFVLWPLVFPLLLPFMLINKNIYDRPVLYLESLIERLENNRSRKY